MKKFKLLIVSLGFIIFSNLSYSICNQLLSHQKSKPIVSEIAIVAEVASLLNLHIEQAGLPRVFDSTTFAEEYVASFKRPSKLKSIFSPKVKKEYAANTKEIKKYLTYFIFRVRIKAVFLQQTQGLIKARIVELKSQRDSAQTTQTINQLETLLGNMRRSISRDITKITDVTGLDFSNNYSEAMTKIKKIGKSFEYDFPRDKVYIERALSALKVNDVQVSEASIKKITDTISGLSFVFFLLNDSATNMLGRKSSKEMPVGLNLTNGYLEKLLNNDLVNFIHFSFRSGEKSLSEFLDMIHGYESNAKSKLDIPKDDDNFDYYNT